MNDVTVKTPRPAKPRRWLRVTVWVLGLFVVLLVAVYFVATSSAFFKGFVLPRVGKAMNATVSVSDASISPFKEVVLRNLKVQTTGEEPLVTAAEVRARYRLRDILGGRINVDLISLSSPTVTLVENADGTSNLDPIRKSQAKPKETAPGGEAGAKPAKPAQVDLKKLALTDATVRRIKLYPGGARDVSEVSHINATLDDLKNGQTAKLALNAEVKIDNNPPSPGTNCALQAKLGGNFSLALSADLKPVSIQGSTRLDIGQATGGLSQADGLGVMFECDVSPTEIKQASLRFQRGETRLGEVRLSGPFDMAKTEGQLTVQILNIDRHVLNLAGAQAGLDFGPTTINSSNSIQLAKSGKAISANGEFNLNKFQVTRAGQTTPQLELRADYNVAVDPTARNALLRSLTLNGLQKGAPLVHGELTSPMTLAWGEATNAVGDSALNFALTHLDLADWKPFLGDLAPAGDVNGSLQLRSQQAGKQLTFDLEAQIAKLTVRAGSNQIAGADVKLKANGRAGDLQQFDLAAYSLQIARQDQRLLDAFGSGSFDTAAQAVDLQLNAQLALPQVLQAMPRPDVTISSGAAELKAHLTQRSLAPGGKNAASVQTIVGQFALTDFTGQFGSNSLRHVGTRLDLDVSVKPALVEIRNLSGKLTGDGKPGGAFELSGTLDRTNGNARFNAKLTDFNQDGLRPFLEPLLADKKLVTVAINGSASADYQPNGPSSLKADVQLANLVVNDPKGQFPATPLEAKMQVDTTLNKQVAEVRQFQLALTPTQRARNELRLSGRVDMSDTNAIQGKLTLAADSLDVTSYYDLFAGPSKAPAPKSGSTSQWGAPAAARPSVEQEPEAKTFPFRNFIAELNIGRFYLRELEITNLQATTKLDGGKVLVKPAQLALNGAPVSASVDLDLGVPGYKYDVAFNALGVPFAPLVNSFQPERKGQMGGTLSAQMQIKGAGTTGPSLQKNLAGQFDIGSTNLNLAVINIRSRLLKTIVNLVGAVPGIIKNPDTALTGLVGTVFGGGGQGGGWADELSRSPVDIIQARGKIGGGRVDLESALVQSRAFQAEARGTVTLAPVLTNSALNLPLSFHVQRAMAERFDLVPAGTPTNALYVKLPDFATEKGTVGEPKTDINKTALLGLGLQKASGLLSGGNTNTANLVRGLGALLGGRNAGDSNAPAGTQTNRPSAAESAVGNLLDNLLKPRDKTEKK